MREEFSRVLCWGWLVVGLSGALSVGCDDGEDGGGDGDDKPAELTDFDRGRIAETRWDACGVEPWSTLSVNESLGILATTEPFVFGPGIDCLVAATSCDEVDACNKYFLLDDHLVGLPECDSERTERCDGNVVRYCLTDDDVTWYEKSYDCALAGATCGEGLEAGAIYNWADCLAPEDLCDGKPTSYCDGSIAVVCYRHNTERVTGAAFDCADAFGSTCAERPNGDVQCEGPAVGEVQCDDGKDNDGDGHADCDDSDCGCD